MSGSFNDPLTPTYRSNHKYNVHQQTSRWDWGSEGLWRLAYLHPSRCQTGSAPLYCWSLSNTEIYTAWSRLKDSTLCTKCRFFILPVGPNRRNHVRSPRVAVANNHVFCPTAEQSVIFAERCVRVCLRARVPVTHRCISTQQLWGSRPHCDVSVAMETARAGEGLREKWRKAEEGRWGMETDSHRGGKIYSSCWFRSL